MWLVPSNNLGSPSSNFLTARSKAVLLLWINFVICVSCHSLQPCGHLLKRADPFAILHMMFLVFSSLSHKMSWVRCGIRLYGFLICAFFLTFMWLIPELTISIKTQTQNTEFGIFILLYWFVSNLSKDS